MLCDWLLGGLLSWFSLLQMAWLLDHQHDQHHRKEYMKYNVNCYIITL